MTSIYEFKIANSATVRDIALDCLFLTRSTDYSHVIVHSPSQKLCFVTPQGHFFGDTIAIVQGTKLVNISDSNRVSRLGNCSRRGPTYSVHGVVAFCTLNSHDYSPTLIQRLLKYIERIIPMKTNLPKTVKTSQPVSLLRVRRRYRLSFIWLTLCIIFCVTNCFAGTTITLNAGTAEPFITVDGGGFYGVLTREIFARIGIDAKVIRLPSARSIINANEGIDDGVIARTAGVEEKYKNLIRVPESVVTFKFVAYSLDKKIHVTGWDSFAPYSVGYIRGWRIYEKNLAKAKSVTVVNNAEQLFRLLMNGRADLIMFEYYRGTWWNEHLNANAHIIGSPVAENEMYIYMHNKHKDLVPKINQALQAMKQDGTYQKIKDETLPEYAK